MDKWKIGKLNYIEILFAMLSASLTSFIGYYLIKKYKLTSFLFHNEFINIFLIFFILGFFISFLLYFVKKLFINKKDNKMKRKTILIILTISLIFLLILISFMFFKLINNIDNDINFKLFQKANNTFIYNAKIDKIQIKKFLDNYDIIINKILNDNGIGIKNVLDKKFTAIIVKDNFDEIKLINKSIIKKINKNKTDLDMIDSTSIYNQIFLHNIPRIGGIYIPLKNVILIKFYQNKDY